MTTVAKLSIAVVGGGGGFFPLWILPYQILILTDVLQMFDNVTLNSKFFSLDIYIKLNAFVLDKKSCGQAFLKNGSFEKTRNSEF